MNIGDGFKFWIGKELGELAFALGFICLLLMGFMLWAAFAELRSWWRKLVRKHNH